MTVAELTSLGWYVNDGVLTIDWDSYEHNEAVKEEVVLLMKGCKCETGCKTGRCSCRKKGQTCFEGCSCVNCLNLPVSVDMVD